MKIETILKIWYDSKYDYIHITFPPVINHLKEVVCPSISFKKNDKLKFGNLLEVDVVEHLKKVYNDYIFVFTTNSDDTLYFNIIGEIE